ncbi:hypothetical protein APA_4615 [Pseudanabaena sp. lw0831]|nr:hypothetical protein [Pseudanabaena sp. lw0831]GBO56285.1 hypothetical protein APA_4615 [Pseudanabaena sp. lw0831]
MLFVKMRLYYKAKGLRSLFFFVYPHTGDRIENQSVIISLIGSGYLL